MMSHFKSYNQRPDYNFHSNKTNIEDFMIKSSRFGNSLKTKNLTESGHTIRGDLANQTQGFSQFFVQEVSPKRISTLDRPQTQRESIETPHSTILNTGRLRNSEPQLLLSHTSKLLFSYTLIFDFKSNNQPTVKKPLVIEMFENVKGPSGGFMMRISDPEELEFLFIGMISKEKFYLMKKQQNLRLDFSELANKLEEMIQLCLEQTNIKQNQVQHRAVLEVEGNSRERPSAIFRIVQENEFRESDHISIEMIEAGDKVLVKYLSERLRNEINVRKKKEIEGNGLRLVIEELQNETRKLGGNLIEINKQRESERKETGDRVKDILQKEKELQESIKMQLGSELEGIGKIRFELETELNKTKNELRKKNEEILILKTNLDNLNKTSSFQIVQLTKDNQEFNLNTKKLNKEMEEKKEKIIKLELNIASLTATNLKNEELIRESHELKEEARRNAETHMKMGESSQITIKELRAVSYTHLTLPTTPYV